MKVHQLGLISVLSLFVIGQAWAAASGLGLKPGVSMPNAFLGQEPAAPSAVQEAINMKSRVEQLDKLLDQEHDALEKQSMNLQKQAGLQDSAPGGNAGASGPDQASIAQAMAMANQMRQGGGMQGMMMYMQYMSSDAYREGTMHWTNRMHEAQMRLHDAESWLSHAKDQVKVQECPDVTVGEATIKDEKCMKAAAAEYNNKMRELATSYLGKVNSAISAAMTATKVRVDDNEKIAAKLNAMKGGAIQQTQVITLHQMAVKMIQKYNELVRTAVDTVVDVANAANQSGGEQ